MSENKEVLLHVSHLKKYFRTGGGTLKAVDDVSFDIYKGDALHLKDNQSLNHLKHLKYPLYLVGIN